MGSTRGERLLRLAAACCSVRCGSCGSVRGEGRSRLLEEVIAAVRKPLVSKTRSRKLLVISVRTRRVRFFAKKVVSIPRPTGHSKRKIFWLCRGHFFPTCFLFLLLGIREQSIYFRNTGSTELLHTRYTAVCIYQVCVLVLSAFFSVYVFRCWFSFDRNFLRFLWVIDVEAHAACYVPPTMSGKKTYQIPGTRYTGVRGTAVYTTINTTAVVL